MKDLLSINKPENKISFEVGIFQLGGNSINMGIDFEIKEPLEDKVGYLNCWIDYLVIRYKDQDIIGQIAKKAHFSVIMPCQDIVTPVKF